MTQNQHTEQLAEMFAEGYLYAYVGNIKVLAKYYPEYNETFFHSIALNGKWHDDGYSDVCDELLTQGYNQIGGHEYYISVEGNWFEHVNGTVKVSKTINQIKAENPGFNPSVLEAAE